MIQTLAVRGPAFDRGVRQGHAHAGSIATWVERQGGAFGGGLGGWLGRSEAGRAAVRGPGRALQRHLTQAHESLAGLARGAGVALRPLLVAELGLRVGGVAVAGAGELTLALDLPADLWPLILLRRSEPDAVGIPSVELSAAPWVGCLAGVNAHGIAVAVLEDRCPGAVPLRMLAQDLLLRASDLDAGARHLELRGRYAGGTGALLLASASEASAKDSDPSETHSEPSNEGRALRVEFDDGRARVSPEPTVSIRWPDALLRIDLAERALRLQPPDGSVVRLGLDATRT